MYALFILWDADYDHPGRNQHHTKQGVELFNCGVILRFRVKLARKAIFNQNNSGHQLVYQLYGDSLIRFRQQLNTESKWKK